MIVNVKRKELLTLAKKVASAAPPTASVEEIKGILLEADERAGTLRMAATNFEVAIQAVMPASVESGGSAVINANLFLNILSLLPDDNLYLEAKPNSQLYLRGGNTHYHIAVKPGGNYPKVAIPLPGDTIFVTGLKSLINSTSFAVSKMTEANPVFNCVNLSFSKDGLRACAGSNRGIVQVIGDKEAVGQISLLVPFSSLKLLGSLSQDSDVYELGVIGTGPSGKNVVLFDGTLTFSARLIDGRFIDTEQVFKDFIPAAAMEIEADALKAALDNAVIAAGASDTVGFTFIDGGLLLKCETDHGATSIKVQAAVHDPLPGEFHLHAHQLKNCIRTLNGKISMSFSAEGNLLIQTERIRYMQPAARPKQKTEQLPQGKEAA